MIYISPEQGNSTGLHEVQSDTHTMYTHHHQSLATRRRRSIIIGVIGMIAGFFLVRLFFPTREAQPLPARHSEEATRWALQGEHLLRAGLLPPDLQYARTDTVIIVPGHGVFRGLNAEEWANENQWGLDPHFHEGSGLLIRAIAQHIKMGLQELKDDVDRSIVVFSGGQTKPGAGPRSEGLSYYLLMEATKLFGLFPVGSAQAQHVMTTRVFAEEYSRDSYENLLFSVCRFKEVTGHYPSRIVVVGWEYKRRRFEDLHRVALRWPKQRFRYIGVDIVDAAKQLGVLSVPDKLLHLSDDGTLERTKSDLYLCRANRKTREERNPQRRVIPYYVSCPELRELLGHCGPELFDASKLPWGDGP